MPGHSTQRQKALGLLERHGIMRLSDLMGHGIHPPTLARLVEEGLVVRASRGLYERSYAEFDLAHALDEIAKRVPRGLICLISAMQFHEISLQLARSGWMASGEKCRKL